MPDPDFRIPCDGRETRYRFALEDGNWFYLAGIWQPATHDWPESYAILTVGANPEVARYQDRQGAVLLRRQRMAWLDHAIPEEDLLPPPPAHSFDVTEMSAGAAQAVLPI